jgi:hypothetical protein
MTGTSGAAVPLARLVVFMLCLSVAGAFVAGLHYYAVDLPQQNAVQAPGNVLSDECRRLYDACKTSCERFIGPSRYSSAVWIKCRNNCENMRDSCAVQAGITP